MDGIPAPLQVKSGKDDNALMQQLGDYLTDNDAVLQEYFRQADKDKSGEAEACHCHHDTHADNCEH